MKRFLKNLTVLALAATFMVGTLAGCGSNNSNDSQPSSNPSSESTGEEAPEGEQSSTKSGDNILKYGQSSFDGKFNSIMANTVYDNQINYLVFDKLVMADATGTWYNWLAEDYTLENDNRTYVFKIHENVYFTDGVQLTTEDVAFTFETVAHANYNGPRMNIVSDLVGYEEFHSGASDTFEGIEIVDEYTIKFTFNSASPANIRNFDYGILPKHYYEFDDFNDFLALISTPLGSGPMILTNYEPEQYIELTKNENYWRDDVEVKVDGVLVSIIPKESMLPALQTGQVDFTEPDISPDTWEALKAIPGVQAYSFLGNGYTYMQFNTLKPTLEDVRVRQALLYALDRESFIAAQYGAELADVGTAPISPVSWAFPDASELNEYSYDLDKARELMAEAGWEIGSSGYLEKDGEIMSLTWFVYTDTDWPQTLSAMAADSWGQIGVDLKIELMDFVTVGARVQDSPLDERDFDIYTMGFSLTVDPDPSGGLFDYDQYMVGGFNSSGLYNERSQELIALGRQEFDQDKRAEYYKEWAILMNELVPTAIVAYRYPIWGISERVSGMEISAFNDWTYSIFDIELN